MSFRKRSVKPNLLSTRRTASTSKPKEKDNGVVENSVTEQEKATVDDTLNAQTCVSSNVTDDALAKVTVSPKKLSKRVKVIPKFGTRNVNVEVEPPEKEAELKSSATGNIENVSSLICDKSRNENAPLDIVPVESSAERTKTGLETLSDVARSSGGKVESQPRPTDKKSTGNRLQKRMKLTPNLSRRNKATTEDTNSDKVDTHSLTTLETLENSVSLPNNDLELSESTAVHESATNFSITKDVAASVGNRLQKRLKVAPKLTKIKVPNTASKNERTEIEDDSVGNTLSIENAESDAQNAIKISEKNSDDILNYSPRKIDEVKSTEATTLESQTVDVINKSTDKIQEADVDNSKKDMRRVHFNEQSEEEKETNLHLLSEICSSKPTVELEIVEDASKSVSNEQTSTMDLVEPSSQSESEMIGSVKLKKKTFKPNLTARRRKRLSSFSAYSSCDEDDEDQAKKKHKKKLSQKKSAYKDSDEETETQTEKTKPDPKKKKRKKKVAAEKSSDVEDEENSEDEESSRKKEKKEPRRAFCSVERDLSTLTMQELIYYRPKSFKKVELRSKKEADENPVQEIASILKPVSDVKTKVKVDSKDDDVNSEEVIAPQLMINEDGQIVVNEESLMLKKKVDDSALRNSAVVYEDNLSFGTNSRRKTNRGKRWKIDETLRFYKALSQIGTDFTLMSQAFGRFTRNDLKKKFKQEEKVNCDLVDRALSNRLPLNMEMFLRGKEEMRDLMRTESEISEVPNPVELDAETPCNSNETNET